MMSTNWIDVQADRLFAHQRAGVDTAKLVATFAAAVAASLVASALEVGPPSAADRQAAWLLGASVALALVVVLLDRLTVADHRALLERGHLLGWSAEDLLSEFRVATLKATKVNEGVVRSIRVVLAIEIVVSLAAALRAASSLLDGSARW
jgi:hypothetical protein